MTDISCGVVYEATLASLVLFRSYCYVKNFRVKHHNAILACVAAVSHISNHFSNIVYLNPNRRVSGSELTDKDRVATAKDLKISSAEEPKFILISD